MTVTELIHQLQELVRMGIVGPACEVKITEDTKRKSISGTTHVISEDFTNKAPYILLS